MAAQYSFIIVAACIVIGASVASAQFPVSQTNANFGNIPAVGPLGPPGPGVIPRPDLDSFYAYPRYNYHYHVADPISGDFKHHGEERDGPNVRGTYALVEPSGSIRTVHYVADELGFRANVLRSPAAHVPGPGGVRGPLIA